MPEKASIIILTYNNLEYTWMCLESIYARTDYPDFEVIVVDNASQDKTPQFLQEFAEKHNNLRLVLSPINHGFPKGNNLGAAQATGDYLVFLNNDTIVTEGWLSGLIRHLQEPTVGMVGPVTNSSGNESRIVVTYEDVKDMPAFARQYTREHAGEAFEIPMLAFLCVAIRRRVLEEIGPLEEMFGQGMFEDDDYARRVKQHGYRILCAEDVFVHHWGSASFSRIQTSAYFRLFKENRKKFEQKWGEIWRPPLLRPELFQVQVQQLFDGALWLSEVIAQQEDRIRELEQKLSTTEGKPEQVSSSLPSAPAGSDLGRRIRNLSQELRQMRGESGLIGMVKNLPSRIRRTSTYQRLKARVFLSIPPALRNYYTEFRTERPFVDRSQVVLYASPDLLPGYTPRAPLALPDSENRSAVKVSLIATVRNEASSAQEWLSSLLSQSRKPDEVVIVDGGSTDGTVGILKDFAHSYPIPLHVIEAPGANIARGRNIAIQNARYPVIACTDFGCRLDRDWFHNLVLPFEADEKIEVSAGFYEPIYKDILDRAGARFFVNRLDTINPQTFLPSSRSLAMKKKFWVRAGGYPEWLTDAGEDTAFDLQAKSQTARWAFVPQAKVFWRAPRFFRKMYRSYYRYAIGDGEAGTFSQLYASWAQKLIGLYWRRALFLVLIILSLLFKNARLWLLPAIAGAWLALFIASVYRNARERKTGLIHSVLHLWMDETLLTARVLGFARGVARRDTVRKRQALQFTSQLEQILEQHSERKGIVIYPPTHDWGFMFQRPHQIARAFARRDYLYFYCTNNEITDNVVGFQEVEPRLYICHVPANTFQSLQAPIVYLGAAWHRALLPLFDRPITIYDHYDDLEVSAANPADHEYLLDHADIVLVTSERLREKEHSRRPDALFTPNGVDYGRIQQARPAATETPPPDWEAITARGCPVIGYAGALAKWFDYELLARAATERPDLEFVLIGVNYDQTLDRSGILTHSNVHWLGMKPYNELFQYVWRFDVGIIPFCINNITLATSPIKLFEYMACQKPVVTTALPECRRYPGVLVADTSAEFVQHLDTALTSRQDPTYLDLLDQTARQNTWDSRVSEIIIRLQSIQSAGKSMESV